MKARIDIRDKQFTVDLSKPIDISIPLAAGDKCVNAFGLPAPAYEPFRVEGFVGSRAEGGPVNCENIFLNPHGNGTHTECVGHIAHERITIHSVLTQFAFTADLVTVPLVAYARSDEKSVQKEQLEAALAIFENSSDALIIRTLPNSAEKLTQKYSGCNPGFIDIEAMEVIVECGYTHLLVDLPSVDPEVDGGKLLAHHAFWDYPKSRSHKTITEMVYVPESVEDGQWLLHFQIASIESDASPSKPVLYELLAL